MRRHRTSLPRRTVPRELRPPPKTIQPRHRDMYRLLRAEYCNMAPRFRGLQAMLRKVGAGGEFAGQRLPTLETLMIWSAGGLDVPGCWESHRPWEELAALKDARTVTMEQIREGTVLAGEVRKLMEEALSDPVARAKLKRDPALLLKVAAVVGGGQALAELPVKSRPYKAEPPEPEAAEPIIAKPVEEMSDEELQELLREQG